MEKYLGHYKIFNLQSQLSRHFEAVENTSNMQKPLIEILQQFANSTLFTDLNSYITKHTTCIQVYKTRRCSYRQRVVTWGKIYYNYD